MVCLFGRFCGLLLLTCEFCRGLAVEFFFVALLDERLLGLVLCGCGCVCWLCCAGWLTTLICSVNLQLVVVWGLGGFGY